MMAAPGGFWNRKRVLLTGHTGFNGVWLSIWLQSMGAEVFGYSTSSPSSTGNQKFAVRMESFAGDICDAEGLRKALDQAQPEVVFHLAAQPFVRRAFEDPIGTYKTNVIGTATLLEALRHYASVRAIVVITTDKCYENKEWDWAYRENDPLGGGDPYSSSKACMEQIVRSFRDSFFFDNSQARCVGLATARAGNMIGGGDWGADRLVPDVMRSFATGKPVTLRNPAAKRPWQYVLEALRGYLMLAQALVEDPDRYSGAWNFGPDPADVRPVQWIVEMLAKAWGPEAQWIVEDNHYPQETPMLRLDCSLAAAELLWTPICRLSEALEWTVDWYRDFYSGRDIEATYRRQIAAYVLRQNQRTASVRTSS